MTRVAGLDIGGANLKVAIAEKGVLADVRQVPCALWRGVDQLELALTEVSGLIGKADVVRVTMTGELADVFPDRYTGVSRIVEVVVATLGPDVQFWMGRRGFGTASEAVANHMDVASTNFVASAVSVSARLPAQSGMLIDMGSTTTDLVAFERGTAFPIEFTDAGRLASGELVYTGLTRTPVMAVTTRGVVGGRWQTLARDPFATMADVYRILGTLPDGADQHRTADGRGVSLEESCARLARCFGYDAGQEQGDIAMYRLAARHIAEVQMHSIVEAYIQHLSTLTDCGDLIVSAGIGSGIVAELARRAGAEHMAFADAMGVTGDLASVAGHCAPAVALALL